MAEPERTIALFGGSFNPPHVAHQLAALWVLETQAVDELWFVPTFTHVFGKQLADYEQRVAMCELAAEALGPRVRVSTAEAELARTPDFVASRTLDLLLYLEHAHPHVLFRLTIGADILAETDRWHRWEDIARRAPPIVIARPGFHGGVSAGMPTVSSTHVRALLARLATERDTERDTDAAGALSALVPARVLRYIAAHGLYT
jgi:nicotinate-nucleotide adenylyltransferase